MIFIFNNTRIITIMIVLLTSILSTKSLRIYKNNLIIRNVKKHSTSNPESSKSTPSSTDIIIKHPMWNREYLSEILLNASMLSHPQKRKFLRLQDTLFMNNLPHTPITTTVKGKIRVLQFNMLADGLSGLRDDLGAFSRIAKEHIDWEHRKNRILHEILQYDPDVITLQECDHFYDWFLPLLTEKGYDGLFAPKPASACLEVSENSDGCAVFARRSKLLVTSVETLTYALSKSDVSSSTGNNIISKTMIGSVSNLISSGNTKKSSRPMTEDMVVRPQNQVALIVVCRLLSSENSGKIDEKIIESLPSIVISTTHLKASKNEKGERFRTKEISQLLACVDRITSSLAAYDPLKREPLVLFTGDLNASPIPGAGGYQPWAYRTLKAHSLGLKSVLNDDSLEPFQTGELPSIMGINIDPAIQYYSQNDMKNDDLEVSQQKTEKSFTPQLSNFDDSNVEKFSRDVSDLNYFPDSNEYLNYSNRLTNQQSSSVSNNRILPNIGSMSSNFGSIHIDFNSLFRGESSDVDDVTTNTSSERVPWTTWKVRNKRGKEEESRMCIDYILYTPPMLKSPSNVDIECDLYGQILSSSSSSSSVRKTSQMNNQQNPIRGRNRPVGFRAKTVLDLLSAYSVGSELLPSPLYPSDHLAIASDLEIVEITENSHNLHNNNSNNNQLDFETQ